MTKPLVRFALFVFSLLLSLISLIFIAFLIWMRYDRNFEYYLRRIIIEEDLITPNVYNSLIVTFWVLLGMGIASLVIFTCTTIIAIIGTKWMFWNSFLFILILALTELGIGIFVLVIRKNIQPEIDILVSKVYDQNIHFMQALEDRFNCCGSSQHYAQCPLSYKTLSMSCTDQIWKLADRILMASGIFMLTTIVIELLLSAGYLYAALRAKSSYY